MSTRTRSTVTAGVATMLLVAVPAALIQLATWPSRGVPWETVLRSWVREPLSTSFLAGLAYLTAWLVWGLLAAAVAARVSIHAARALRWLPGLRIPGPLQGLTAAVLGATAVSTAAAATPAHAAPSTITALEEADRPSPPTPAVTPDGRSSDGTTASRQGADRTRDTYTVRRGDTLSSIAQRCLGDANRWPEIFRANRGTHFPRVGGTLRDPDLIYPGWTLRLPTRIEEPPPAARPSPPIPPSGHTEPAPPPTSLPSSPARADLEDGVVEPVSPSMTGSAGPAPTSPSARADAPQNPADDQAPAPRPEPAPGVSLGSGSWLDIGLVAAIFAAVALVWVHRRRRYTPRPPTPGLRLDDPTVAPMPSVITRIRRGLRRSHVTSAKPTTADTPPAVIAITIGEDDPDTNDSTSPAVADPAVAALASLPIGMSSAGLGLTGPGAAAAVRGFLVSALAAGGLDEPNGRGQVIIPADTLATLLGAAASSVPDTSRLTVSGGLTDALTSVEEQTLHRTRACAEYEVDTVAALRDADPMAEPLPPLVLVADTTAVGHERARLAALLTQGQHLDIHGILLGNWPDGDTVSVADDGTTIPADGDRDRHGCHPAGIGRLTVIDSTEAVDLLRVIAESHTGEPPPPAPAEPTPLPDTPHTGGGDTAGATPPNDDKAVSLRGRDLPAPEPAATVELPAEESAPRRVAPAPEEHGRAEHGEGAAAPPRDVEPAAGEAGRVKVQVLGDARVIDVDTSQPMRGKSLELLVYLAVRGGTASQEAILEDLLPEATTSKAPTGCTPTSTTCVASWPAPAARPPTCPTPTAATSCTATPSRWTCGA